MTQQPPIVSAPLVWAELVTTDMAASSAFYGTLLGWKSMGEPGATDLVVYLDKARVAGPVAGIRPRTHADPQPEGLEGPAPDRWTVRLSPPRPPAAVDPVGDQILRPRAPGPRLGRWGAPNSLCYAELRTPDVEGARAWIEHRLDGVLEPADPTAAAGLSTLVLQSAIIPGQPVAAIVDEADPAAAGWYVCAQVASLADSEAVALAAGARSSERRPVPLGCPGTAAATVTDPGGGRLILVEHGPRHGRR